jgi:hypothetical protein
LHLFVSVYTLFLFFFFSLSSEETLFTKETLLTEETLLTSTLLNDTLIDHDCHTESRRESAPRLSDPRQNLVEQCSAVDARVQNDAGKLPVKSGWGENFHEAMT